MPAGLETAFAALCERHVVDVEGKSQLEGLLTALAAAERAPTTVTDPRLALSVHLADSLMALDIEQVRMAGLLVDIGAGAGFPGLPLAAALPRARVRLVESRARKCKFIEALCASTGISNTEVVNARAEDWPAGIGIHDVVMARALAAQPVVLEYAAPLLRLGGVLVDWRGRRNSEEERAADLAAAELGLRCLEIRHVEPYTVARDHHLHVFEKVELTPDHFPRRAGMARKRPLGGQSLPATPPDPIGR